jgi:hypothetical protein
MFWASKLLCFVTGQHLLVTLIFEGKDWETLSPQFVANKGFHDIKQQSKQPPPVPSHQAKGHWQYPYQKISDVINRQMPPWCKVLKLSTLSQTLRN